MALFIRHSSNFLCKGNTAECLKKNFQVKQTLNFNSHISPLNNLRFVCLLAHCLCWLTNGAGFHRSRRIFMFVAFLLPQSLIICGRMLLFIGHCYHYI